MLNSLWMRLGTPLDHYKAGSAQVQVTLGRSFIRNVQYRLLHSQNVSYSVKVKTLP